MHFAGRLHGRDHRYSRSASFATTYVYDGLQRQIAEQTPAGGTATTVYDHDGNVIAQIDELGHATSYSYDALNRQVTETDALNAVTTYAYDAGLATRFPDGCGRQYHHDGLRRS